jgi:hypothetical protein
MKPLTASDIVRVWEQGYEKHPIEQAMLFLSSALPESSVGALAELAIGQREALLLTLREITLGGTLACAVACPQCGERLEFEVAADDIRMSGGDGLRQAQYEIEQEGWAVTYRLPDSRDMASAALARGVEAAREELIARCVLFVEYEGSPVERDGVPESLLTAVADDMAQNDPQADTLFDLTCPNCGFEWQALLDMASFLWIEAEASAKRLLDEVHVLARAYGWHESEVLAMSSARRQHYLEMATQ